MANGWPEHDPRARIIRMPGATNSAFWPKAPSKFAFILEAIEMAGLSIFKGEWTGRELGAVVWPKSPKSEREQARVPRGQGGGSRGSRDGSLPIPHKRAPDFHVADWHAEKRQPIWEANEKAGERLFDCVDWLAQQCRDGELKSFARLKAGGEIYAMQASEWNVDTPLLEFVVNGGNCRRFYEMGYRSGPFDSYVFFDRNNLEHVLANRFDAPVSVDLTDLSQVSPYLQLAVRLALGREYFSKNDCETQGIREAEIRTLWPELISDIDPVQSMVTAIAKVINFPNPEAIKKGQRGGQTRKTGVTPRA